MFLGVPYSGKSSHINGINVSFYLQLILELFNRCFWLIVFSINLTAFLNREEIAQNLNEGFSPLLHAFGVKDSLKTAFLIKISRK